MNSHLTELLVQINVNKLKTALDIGARLDNVSSSYRIIVFRGYFYFFLFPIRLAIKISGLP